MVSEHWRHLETVKQSQYGCFPVRATGSSGRLSPVCIYYAIPAGSLPLTRCCHKLSGTFIGNCTYILYRTNNDMLLDQQQKETDEQRTMWRPHRFSIGDQNIIADPLQPLMHCQTINIIGERLKECSRESEDLIWTTRYFKSQTNSAIMDRN